MEELSPALGACFRARFACRGRPEERKHDYHRLETPNEQAQPHVEKGIEALLHACMALAFL